jgi:valine--pyruvate aminotransferase
MISFSTFGEHFRGSSGTRQLMDDLGEVLTSERAIMNLGGGNPGIIPAAQVKFREAMQRLLDDGRFDDIVARYDGPQGYQPFRRALADLLCKRYGWSLGEENIAITSGSQGSFFSLFNMFSGVRSSGEPARILLPLTPEYIGYADISLQAGSVRSIKPTIEITGPHEFKYHIDFDRLQLDDDVAAVCVSRPTNPTGNVITNDELGRLMDLTRDAGVPLIVDNAYGLPFPDIVFADAVPVFDDHVILCMSLSKLGLPGVRTGIIVAAPEIIDAVTGMNALSVLANGALGAGLVTDMVASGEILTLAEQHIRPFYATKCAAAQAWCHEAFAGVDYYLHKTEGAIFLWVWFPGLPISDIELYDRLKARDVLVLAGSYFFPGLADPWPHTRECLRISYAQDEAAVRRGIAIIGEEVHKAFAE